jgi:hypothetical protein
MRQSLDMTNRRNIGASVRARLLGRAHEQKADFQAIAYYITRCCFAFLGAYRGRTVGRFPPRRGLPGAWDSTSTDHRNTHRRVRLDRWAIIVNLAEVPGSRGQFPGLENMLALLFMGHQILDAQVSGLVKRRLHVARRIP